MRWLYTGIRVESGTVFYLRWRDGYIAARGFDNAKQADYICVKRGLTTHGTFNAEEIHSKEQLGDVSK